MSTFGGNFVIDPIRSDPDFANGLACVAWRFWLLSNKGGDGRKTARRLGQEQLKNRLHGRGAFLSRSYASVRIVPIGSECSPVNQYFGNFRETEQIFSSKQNQNMAEALTRALSLLNIRREIVQLC